MRRAPGHARERRHHAHGRVARSAASAFPVTFSISAPGRTGELGIQIDALDASGLARRARHRRRPRSRRSTRASVLLDSADFVVNTEFADDQFLSDDFEANGFQLAATADGTWTAAYRDRCTAPCNMFGRRFDATGKPVDQLAAGTKAFPFTTSLTTSLQHAGDRDRGRRDARRLGLRRSDAHGHRHRMPRDRSAGRRNPAISSPSRPTRAPTSSPSRRCRTATSP